uniref:Uncharacterized protein n=1 Tax=Timema cristinae TaxID=61476 RepID=A0A7R9DAM4_TIMCR|nr:unnamed protein product [Timema cristinae]
MNWLEYTTTMTMHDPFYLTDKEENFLGRTSLTTPDRYSNPDITVIGSPVSCEINALWFGQTDKRARDQQIALDSC